MDHTMYTLVPLRWSAPTWPKLADSYGKMAKNDEQRKALLELLNFYKQELGRGFFDTCDHNHPICSKLTVNLHNLEDLFEFTEFLKELKENDPGNYTLLLQKLKPRKKCQSEGIPFTDVCRMFSKTGFKFSFLTESNKERCADIRITDEETGDSIYIEVSQLLLSDNQRSIQKQHSQLSNTIIDYGYDLPKACKQLKHLDEAQMKKTIAMIRAMKDEAAAQKKCCVYEDEFIKFAVTHPERIAELDEWCARHQIQRNSVGGLEVNFNDTPRLVDRNKIIGEIRQLPAGQPGTVYIPVSVLYFYSMDKAETATAIMQQLENYPDCLGVILFVASVGTLPHGPRIEEDHFTIGVSEYKGLSRHILYVGNPWFTGTLSEITYRRFRDSLC
ncbi:hypothetical protein [Terrimonas ferruginea]|uniref:hypothetical protein n=1 Tax=Terrimonas ferruginea TaxID=249 RepID=UPI000421E827|nr:hypothetical protein [Terrimonas ferruginea]